MSARIGWLGCWPPTKLKICILKDLVMNVQNVAKDGLPAQRMGILFIRVNRVIFSVKAALFMKIDRKNRAKVFDASG